MTLTSPTKPGHASARVVANPERDLIATLLHSAVADTKRWCPVVRWDANEWFRLGANSGAPLTVTWVCESLGLDYGLVMKRLVLVDPTRADWTKWMKIGKKRRERYENGAAVEIIRSGRLTQRERGAILTDETEDNDARL